MTSVILCIFIAGYALIALEGWTKVNKSAVAILMAVCCWTLYYWGSGASAENVSAFTKALGETSEILFFLMGAMVIVEVVDTNGGFDWVREKLVSRTKAGLLWKLTLATFFLSAVLDNMTTAIIMVMILDKLVSDRRDKLLYASMVILAANSGGAFSPIGDVTTIMLWVKGNISTFGVIRSLFLPSIVSVLVPAVILTFFLRGRLEIGREDVQAEGYSNIGISPKERIVVFLIGVGGLPPFMGILLILAILFFLGILTTVSALSETGILKSAGTFLERISDGNPYIVTGSIGFLSAVVDNVPLVASCMGMYDVVTSGTGAELYGIDGTFWELLAYSGGIGGSMLIIGSAAGVVVMGLQKISFGWYLKHFSWIACIGYLAGILTYWVQDII